VNIYTKAGLAIGALILLTICGIYVKQKVAPLKLSASKPIVANLPTETKVLPVKVITRKAAESRLNLNLPPGHSATATADLPPSEEGYEVVSVLDETTGETQIEKQEKPKAPLSWRQHGSVSVGYGSSLNHGQRGDVRLEYSPVRVLGTEISGEVQAVHFQNPNEKDDLVGMVRATYRF
jgi:hypothetical protein